AAIAGVAARPAAVAGHRGNYPASGDSTNAFVCDEQVSLSVHRNGARTAQLCFGGWPAITQTGSTASSHRDDGPVWGNLSDAAAKVLRDKQVAGTIHRNPPRLHLRAGGLPAISQTGSAAASHRGDDPDRGDFADDT